MIQSALGLFGSQPTVAIMVLNSVYKDSSDDRLCKLADPVLQNCENFIKQNADIVSQDSKLTQLVVHAF